MVEIFGSAFAEMFEPYEVTFEVYVGDTLSNQQVIQAPKEMIIANFIEIAKQVQADKRPIKIRMIRPEIIWDNFEQKQKTINNMITLNNHAMTAYEKDKETEGSDV